MLASRRILLVALAVVLTTTTLARAASDVEKLMEAFKSLKYQSGEITLGANLAKLRLPEKFRYLDPADTRKVLVDLWGNPPTGADSLGMIVPTDVTLLDPKCWATVITWSGDGYINDDDATAIDYRQLLQSMQESVKQANIDRVRDGYPSLELVGWAMPPHYDRESHKLYWAKDLKFGDSDEHTLNYCVRMLARRGVLELNAVGSMQQLDEVRKATPELLNMVSFVQGQRYVDFNPATDQVATYGVAALIAGGVAAKAGLFKGLFVALLAAKKLIIVVIIGALALCRKFIVRLFKGSQETAAQ